MPRYRVSFAKTDAMRFTGNLDVHRTWERMFRRAQLPLAYTEGFSPHPRLTLAAALPLGCLSEGDLIDAWLAEPTAPEAVLSALRLAAPPGLRVDSVVLVEDPEPSLPSQVVSAEFDVELDPLQGEPLATRCAALLAEDSLPRRRRGKTYDLRPLIEALAPSGSGPQLHMRLAAREGATGRPEEVMLAMGLDPARAVCTRKRLILHRGQVAVVNDESSHT
ncbi:MAG TPA: TIGR03936 family radical SAM-associated protein [Anaerolineales bacterium]|nr:TIGR03936 family radical SAM-associated protein [Anaerolineales bacterium]